MLNLRIPLYEGDGYLRLPRSPAASPQRESEHASDEAIDLRAVERKARALKLVTVAKAFSQVFDWLEERYQRARWRDIDAYLSRSADHADLERRLKQLERGNRFEFC